jgi:hypothetical protein
MQRRLTAQHAEGRLVAVGPGLVDVTVTGEAEAVLAQLVFATEHRFRVEVRGRLAAGASGRIEAEFVVSHDGALVEHDVVLFIQSDEGGPQ